MIKFVLISTIVNFTLVLSLILLVETWGWTWGWKESIIFVSGASSLTITNIIDLLTEEK